MTGPEGFALFHGLFKRSASPILECGKKVRGQGESGAVDWWSPLDNPSRSVACLMNTTHIGPPIHQNKSKSQEVE